MVRRFFVEEHLRQFVKYDFYKLDPL